MIKVTLNPDGTESWYKDGKRYRTNGPAFIHQMEQNLGF